MLPLRWLCIFAFKWKEGGRLVNQEGKKKLSQEVHPTGRLTLYNKKGEREMKKVSSSFLPLYNYIVRQVEYTSDQDTVVLKSPRRARL